MSCCLFLNQRQMRGKTERCFPKRDQNPPCVPASINVTSPAYKSQGKVQKSNHSLIEILSGYKKDIREEN